MQGVPLEALDVENVAPQTVQHDVIPAEQVPAQATALPIVVYIGQWLGQLLIFLKHEPSTSVLLITPNSIVFHSAQDGQIA